MIDPTDPRNRLGRYILDAEGNPVLEPDLFKWAIWLEAGYPLNRRVARDELPSGIVVSTVFLGLDHGSRVFGDRNPILFETMVFNDYGDVSDLPMRRYATRGEALAGHQTILRYAREHERELLQAQHKESC